MAFSILLTEILYYLSIYSPASKTLLLVSGFSHMHEFFCFPLNPFALFLTGYRERVKSDALFSPFLSFIYISLTESLFFVVLFHFLLFLAEPAQAGNRTGNPIAQSSHSSEFVTN